ncbi:P-loop containing nucleoside triphosphate hydrolase [Chlorella sorokiniana]|uniref:P-loop containing nucleoside triphosphate hydrolase n=1 Tax=Chlorella sorokiniana TaxID=3076 RepID=A0A2P6TS17_CHLSO|nr:P-loop containing nucleoside triphosphate hydrolase [Chlorella sorokiniana]|eukprot:PRW56860.1 P-loop containing nucleoside triphosphate hydrolase [Chlorella sorokiniana]
MASQPSREELLAAWKAKRAGAAAGGPLQAHNNGAAGRGVATAAAAPAPKPGLPPRLARAPLADKENGQQPAAGGGGAAPARAGSAAPDSVRKAFASGQQKEEMMQEFDALQGRLAALKRDSVRPSISGLGAGGAAAPVRPGLQHSTASTTLRPAAQEPAAARATQPAPVPAASTASAAQPPLPRAPLQTRQQQGEPAAAAAAPPSQQQHAQPQPPQQQEQQVQPSQAMPPPPAVATTRGGGGAGPMDLDGPSLPPSLAASGVGGLAARLESLRRDSVRPSLAGGAAAMQGVQFEAAAPIDMQALSRLALQLFDDEGFRQACDKGLNMQLTRSKDGATAEFRIQELAGLVKLLRRVLKDSQTKASEFVAAACKYEKEVGQQVESVKLSSESERRAVQVDLANSRKEAAAAAAKLKHELANWQSELDMHKGEANRLRREMERVEGERERLREEARRLEGAKQALEAEIKEMRKVAKEEMSELKLEQNSAKQAAYEIREAAERRHQQLSEALAAAEARVSELEEQNEGLQRGADGTHRQAAKLEKQLAELQGDHQRLQEAHDKLLDAHGSAQRDHERVVADSAVMLGDLQGWQEKAEALLAELERERAAHAATQATAADAAAGRASEAEAAAAAAAAADADRTAAAQREEALLAEKAQLKAAVAAVTAERDELQSMVQQAAAEMQAVQQRVEEGSSQQAAMKAEVERLGAQVADLNAALEAEQTARAAAAREAKEKAEKLERLEGELEALQECTIGLGAGDQKEMLTRMLSKIGALEAAVASAEAKRREIHNQLVELKGNIRVFCRLRPSQRSAVQCLPDGLSVRLAGPDGKEHTFGYDKVFKPESSQASVFEEVSDLVQSALDGYKVCLFSYGQTGAGKTHTMQGSRAYEGQGIIPRAISKILESVAKLREQGWEYALEASFIEVYNEQLRDLLADTAPGRREAGRIQENNAIQHQPNGGHTVVLGASRVAIESEEDAEAITRKAAAARVVEATAMNAVSSRSHSVFMLYITGRHEASSTVLQGSLNLVDLAGSERLARSQAEGQRQKEACNINKSLSSLGDVFQALATKSGHIPYRNSKLTHLLQPCLGGSGKTLMFVNVNPEPESVQETLCSLRFAAKVNQCETAAKGGAQRNVSTMEWGSGVAALTGRPSLAPTDAEARRMSMAPGGVKRKPGIPPAAAAPRGIPRPRLG